MIYDYYNYNDPRKGNKNTYAYGEKYESITACGFIHADTKQQAQVVLNANNRAWQQECVLLDFTKQEIEAEIARRKGV